MKMFKRITGLVMAIVMIVSAMSLSLVASAAEINTSIVFNNQKTGFTQATVTNSGNANDTNATALLDWLDKVLKDANIKEEINLYVTKITIDATSVNGLLETIDLVKSVSGLIDGFGSLKNLNCKNWKEGQTRKNTADDVILKNLIKFIYDNRELVADFVDGSFTCNNGGIFGIDIDGILGINPSKGETIIWLLKILKDKDGNPYAYLSDWLKDTLGQTFGMTVTSKTTLDDIVYKGIIGGWLQQYVPGFTMNANTTTEQLVLSLVNSVWNKYIGDLIGKVQGYKDSLSTNPYTAPIAGLVNFDVTAADVQISLNSINNVNDTIGAVLKKIIPTYSGWKTGSKLELISENIVNALKWMFANAQTTENAEVMAKYAAWNEAAEKEANSALLSLVKLVVNAAWPETAYPAIVDAQTTVEGAIIAVLTQVIKENPDSLGFVVIGKKSTTAEKFLGDFAGSYLMQYIPLRNSKGTDYVAGSGTSVYDVANYALNYFLVDLNLDALFGLNLKKSQSLFTKLEGIQKMLLGDLGYVKASEYIPSLVENVLSLDIGGLFTDNVKPIIDDYKDLKACSFVYTIINNLTKSIFGTQVLATSTFKSFENIIIESKKDDNLGKVVANILKGLEGKKADFLPIIYYVYNALFTDKAYTVTGSASDFDLAKSKGYKVTVKYGNYTLVENKDYKVVYSNGGKVGSNVKVTVEGIGDYAGSIEIGTVKITCTHKYGSYTTTKKATCTTDGTKKKTCQYCGKAVTATIEATGHTYKTVITKATTSKSGSKVVKCEDCGKVKSKSTIAKISSVKLSTTSYTYNGKTKTPTVTVKDSNGKTLKNGTDYTVKYSSSSRKNVGTYTVTVTFKGNYSGTKKLTFKIVPKSTSISKLTAGKKSFTAKWSKQSTQTTGYQIQYSTSSKMTNASTKTISKNSTTSQTISGLKSGKKYYVRIRTYKTVNGSKIYSSWSSVKSVKVK